MSSELIPAVGWIVVEQQEVSEVTAGGVIKPASAVDREREMTNGGLPATMTVVAVPTEASAGALSEDGVLYPTVGAKVLVIVKEGTALKYGKRQAFVRIDAVVGEVREAN